MATTAKKTEKNVVKSKFYQKLLQEKGIVEGQFVSCLYGNTDFYYDFEVSVDDFHQSSWRFLYRTLQEMVGSQHLKTIDAVSVGAYASTKNEAWNHAFNKYGGFETIKKAQIIISPENVESYYESLQRYKTALRLVDKGFPIERNWNTYKKLSLDEFNDVLEGLIDEAFIDTQFGKDKVEDLGVNALEMIEKADQGEERGMPLASPLIESIQHGLSTGHITMLAANSGVGKTFLTVMLHILSNIRNKEPLLIIANEESREKYLQAVLTGYINVKHPDMKFNKNRFLQGSFTDEEKECLHEAVDWYKRSAEEGLIRFIGMGEFSMAKSIREIKKFARMYGVRYFIIDTLKLDNDTGSRINDQSWLQMQQNMVKLYNAIKEDSLDVHVWVTAQMAKTNRRTRYLDQSMIGMSKNITDVVSSLMLVRMLSLSEKSGKGMLKVIDKNGHQRQLDEEKDYMVVFWDKNRQGDTSKQVVLQVDRGLNRLEDVGYTQIDNDFD